MVSCQEAKQMEVTNVSHYRKVKGDENEEVKLLDLVTGMSLVTFKVSVSTE